MIHVYPGAGATASMYGTEWRDQVQGDYHNWPLWNGETTIRELAARLIDEHSISDGDILVGSSLGGMVAGEMAKIRDVERVVLLGSAVSKEELSKVANFFHPYIDHAPMKCLQACVGRLPSKLAQMFAESDPGFMKTMIKAIFTWDGFDPSTPRYRIHGSKDMVIPHPGHVDHLIVGARHAIAMSDAEECIATLKQEKIISS